MRMHKPNPKIDHSSSDALAYANAVNKLTSTYRHSLIDLASSFEAQLGSSTSVTHSAVDTLDKHVALKLCDSIVGEKSTTAVTRQRVQKRPVPQACCFLVTYSYVYSVWRGTVWKTSLLSGKCVSFSTDVDGCDVGPSCFDGISSLFCCGNPMKRFDVGTELWFEIPVDGEFIPHQNVALVGFCGLLVTLMQSESAKCQLAIYRRNKWRVADPPGAKPRALGSIFVSSETGVVLCGGQALSETWWLDMRPLIDDPEGGVPIWEKLSNHGIQGAGGAVYKGKLYVFGGVVCVPVFPDVHFDDVAVFDMNARAWTRMAIDGTPDCAGYLYQGEKLLEVAVDMLNPTQEQAFTVWDHGLWTVHPCKWSSPLPRAKAHVYVDDGWLYVSGGHIHNCPTRYFDDIWRLPIDVPSGNKRRWEMVSAGLFWRK